MWGWQRNQIKEWNIAFIMKGLAQRCLWGNIQLIMNNKAYTNQVNASLMTQSRRVKKWRRDCCLNLKTVWNAECPGNEQSILTLCYLTDLSMRTIIQLNTSKRSWAQAKITENDKTQYKLGKVSQTRNDFGKRFNLKAVTVFPREQSWTLFTKTQCQSFKHW